ncbi:MAG: ACP phosphodiesterase [Luteolibacter sp.]
MNWLAHLHLSDPAPATRIGNLLPDILRVPELLLVSQEFAAGIRHHQAIDAYTDNHPVFRESTRRIDPPLRKYGAILVDVFYDHFLACNWSDYSVVPLEAFVADFHTSIDGFRDRLPEQAYARLAGIRDEGWLLSYRQIEGITSALGRISQRLRRPADLSPAVDELVARYDDFAGDFRKFYPQLAANVEG